MSTPFIEQVRTKLAAHAPGSNARFELLHRSKEFHEMRVEQRDCEAWERTCPPGFVPVCPTCTAIPVQRRRGNRWTCTCGASGLLNDEWFITQYSDERVKKSIHKERTKVERWLSTLATYIPDPWIKLPAVVRTSFAQSLTAILGRMRVPTEGYETIIQMLGNSEIWEHGGDAVLYVVLQSLKTDHYRAQPGRPWLNVFRCVNEDNLPSIERAWRLLNVVAVTHSPWLLPNTLVEIQTSTDPVASFENVHETMRALVKRYIDVHYDAVLSDLLATARRRQAGNRQSSTACGNAW